MEKNDNELIQTAIIALLENRSESSTICPSEAPRKLFPENWREKMELTRHVARELARNGEIEICQKGKAIDPESDFRGPIRLRKKQIPVDRVERNTRSEEASVGLV